MFGRIKKALSGLIQENVPEKERRAEEILFPVVRVRTQTVGGSGTVLYSDGEDTYALTNNHVVESAIERDTYWDSYRERERIKESTVGLTCEFFDWRGLREQFASTKFDADVIMRDESRDIALLSLDLPREYPFVARALQKDEIESIEVYDTIWHTGAQVGHEPISTRGHIMYLPEIIDRHKYVMSSAHSIYGSSGGAMYLQREGRFKYCGISSRIAVVPAGFSFDPQSHLSYWIHPEEIYKFLVEWFFDFILDEEKEKEKSTELREKKKEQLKDEWAVKH